MTTGSENLHDRLRRLDSVLDRHSKEEDIDESEPENGNELENEDAVVRRTIFGEGSAKGNDRAHKDTDGSIDDINGSEEGEEYEGPEEPEEPEEPDKIPAYLLDEPPASKVDAIKWYLLNGTTEEELVANGYNMGTVRNCAHELRKAGLYQKPPKESKALTVPGTGKVKKKQSTDIAHREDTTLKSYAKGSPAEDLIRHFARLPDEMRDTEKGETFESGMKFGLSVAVLGIRMAQELSNLGVSQVKPLIDMTKSMREGEALASKSAAKEAAEEAAGQIGDLLGPTMQDIRAGLARQAEPRSIPDDPMRSMIADAFKPIIKQMTRQMMPGGLPGADIIDTDEVVSGWTRRKND